MISLFFTLGSTVHDWGWPKNGPFGAKKSFLSKMVQKGPDGPKRVPNVQKDLG